MKHFGFKVIKNLKKDLSLTEWSIDLEIEHTVKTQILFNNTTKEALIIINNKEAKNFETLIVLIKYQMLRLKYPNENEDEINKRIDSENY